ncbi:MAG: sigma 54-interacting transcriptional regulator [Deltaproteobacteria bacterium]|jgi:arginine utilization regulatory protein|nr:sigma 54-interacting transcriptional regulator [Deltaproteobacteria bacterium]
MHSFGLENLTWGLGSTDLLSQILDDLPVGVIIMNVNSEIVFYNKAQGRIDNFEPIHALGKNLLDLYKVSDNASHPALLSIFSSKPLHNHPCCYFTHQGKLVNSIQNIFPIQREGALVGCIAFTSDFGQSSEEYENFSKSYKNASIAKQPQKALDLDDIVTEDPQMKANIETLTNSADSLTPVMLFGEPGTGKDLFARVMHNISNRKDAPFLSLNCSSMPESLLDGVLFGTEEGAFTGATSKPGLFELANGGTLFLDEINTMPMNLQSKLLRASEENRIRRVGGTEEIDISLKIISSTTMHPREAVGQGSFLPKLMLKLGIVLITLPPLRERLDDLPALSRHFITELNERLGKNVSSLESNVSDALREYLWPGNVQELYYNLESAMNQISQNEEVLQLSHFNSTLFVDVLKGKSVKVNDLSAGTLPKYEPVRSGIFLHRAAEVERIAAALEAAGGNAAKAARSLKISPQLMNYKLKKFCLKKKITVHVERVLNTAENEIPKRPKKEEESSNNVASQLY